MKLSLNNRFIVAPYISERQLQASTTVGYATIKQKVSLKGLKLLVSTQLNKSLDTMIVPKGSTIYVKEEALYTQPWAKTILECDGIEGKFIIIEQQFVEFIDVAEGGTI